MNTGSVLAQFTITLSKAVNEPVAVDWFTSDGTAKSGVDYAANKGTAVFSPGETAKKIDILVLGRAVGSEDRSFFVEMLPPTNAILGASIGECIIHVDTGGSSPVTQIIVPTGPKGDKGDSPDPSEIAHEAAPLIDVGATTLTTQGTEALPKPDATTVKAVARRVAYAAPVKIAIVTLADGDNAVAQSDMAGDTLDMSSEGVFPRILRGGIFMEPAWSIQPDGKMLIRNAIAGDVLYACQYDFISNKKQRTNVRELWRRSLAEAGLTLVDGSFEEGATVNSTTDAVWHKAGNQCYTWSGAFQKVTPADSTPASSGGVVAGGWVSVSDVALRQALLSGAMVMRDGKFSLRDFVSPRDFGAVGDGVTDDGPAIRAAIAALKAADGGTLFFPSGEYLVGAGNPLNSFYALSVDFNGLRIQGDGIWKTSIKVANGANVGPLHLAAATGFEIDNITLDGNAAGQSTTGVHGLAALDADFVIGTNLQIKNTVGYGIGFQGTMTTNFQFVKFDGLYLQDIGGDGTDFKNKALTNKGLVFSNVYVNGVGRTEAGKKAGLDIRGPATLTNIHIYANGNKVTGVRFRGDEILGGPGNPGNGNGIGGRNSSLTNFYMNLEGLGDSDGVVVDNENVSVSNGTVLNVPSGGTGVFATASAKKSRLNNVSAAATGNAILFELAADDLQVSNCTALSAAGLLSVGFRYNGDRIHLENCKSFNGQYGFRRSAGSVPSYLTNCSSYGASSADLVTSVDDFTFNCWFDTSTHKNATVSSGPSKLGEFMYVQDSVNWPRFDPSVSGSPVAIRATGADAAVDLLLAPRGSGNVRFGSFGSSADVPVTGYITIKDAAGTVRKLAVIS